MSEILTRAEFKDELLGTDGNQGWADKLLAHDAALRLALEEVQRKFIAHVGIDCTADSPCLPCRRVLDAEKGRDAALARAESAEKVRDGLMAAFRWCDLRLEQALSAEELDEQPIPGDEMASSIKWRINRVRKKLRDLAAARDSEQRWAKEYHHKWQSAEARLAEWDASRKRFAYDQQRSEARLAEAEGVLRDLLYAYTHSMCDVAASSAARAFLAREVPK